MSEREDLGYQLLLLARCHADDPGRDLKPKSLILIDQLATYASRRHGALPQAISTLLSLAMHAAMRGETSGVIHHLEIALAFADQPPRPSPKTRPEPHVRPKKPQPRSIKAVAAKPLAETIDPLLTKLRAKHPGKR